MSTPNTSPGPGQQGTGPHGVPTASALGTGARAGSAAPTRVAARAAVQAAAARTVQLAIKAHLRDDATSGPLANLAVELLRDGVPQPVWKGKSDKDALVLAPVKSNAPHRLRIPEVPGPEAGETPEGDGKGKPEAPKKGKPKPFVSSPLQPRDPASPKPPDDVRVARPLHLVIKLGDKRYVPDEYGKVMAESGGGDAGRKVGAYAKLVAFLRAPDSKAIELLATASDGRLSRFKDWGPIREVLSTDRGSLKAFVTAEPELPKTAVTDDDLATVTASVERDVIIKGGKAVAAIVLQVPKGEPQRYEPVDSRAGPFIEGGPTVDAKELAGGMTPARAAALKKVQVLEDMILEFRVSEPATQPPVVTGAAFQRLPLATSDSCAIGDPRETRTNLFVTADLDLRDAAPDDPFDELVTVEEPNGTRWTAEAMVQVKGRIAFVTPRGGVAQQVELARVKERKPNPNRQQGTSAMGLVNRVYQLPTRAKVVPREGAGKGMDPAKAPDYAKALARFLPRLFRGIGYHRAQSIDPARVQRVMSQKGAVLLDSMESLLFRVPTTEVADALKSELGGLPGEPLAILKHCLFFGVGESPRQAIAHAIGSAAATHRISVKVLEEDYASSQAREVTERWAVGYFKFATDHPDLDFGLRPIADRVKTWFGGLANKAEVLAWKGKLLVDIKGYASPAGKAADNELLAKERGRRVAEALRECLGDRATQATFSPTYAGSGDDISAPPLHLLGAVGLIDDDEAAAETALAEGKNPATHRAAVVELKRVIPNVTGSTEQIASFRAALPIHHFALLGYHAFPAGPDSRAIVAAVFIYPGQKIQLEG